MTINWLAVLVATLVPTIIGFIWYNPKVFGNTWMKVADMTEEKKKGGNMAIIFGVSLLLSFFLAMSMHTLAIHQNNLPNLFMTNEGPPAAGSEEAVFIENFFSKYGSLHRTFSHGMVHGIFAAFFIILPVLGTNAMFERKGWKYILVNVGYWFVTFAIMGGIICGWV